ncbi:hypothetical protein FF011L_25170 [Roseimaritima multifibrata]|uniref:Uncharacterized protein n=1 Tax=Roseimaritima multifibrata TaxID=1930274 RepID=A0A517MFT0_9BACT|nr:hypothetical protein FF011L_25170 [Roseimaritima multifibrata]
MFRMCHHRTRQTIDVLRKSLQNPLLFNENELSYRPPRSVTIKFRCQRKWGQEPQNESRFDID